MSSFTDGRYFYISTALVLLAGCGNQRAASLVTLPDTSVLARAHNASGSYGYCPANPSGTGILPDGDFSQGLNDGDHFTEPSKGTVFAPDWKVSKRNIDFNGTTFWEMDGYCSVDLDGNNAGGIVASAFPTKPGSSYAVTFLLSGNGGQGKGNPPVVKTMVITAANQFQTFTWDTSNDNDVEHGKFANGILGIPSKAPYDDAEVYESGPSASSRGAVVAAILVAKN